MLPAPSRLPAQPEAPAVGPERAEQNRRGPACGVEGPGSPVVCRALRSKPVGADSAAVLVGDGEVQHCSGAASDSQGRRRRGRVVSVRLSGTQRGAGRDRVDSVGTRSTVAAAGQLWVVRHQPPAHCSGKSSPATRVRLAHPSCPASYVRPGDLAP